jgi:hypothetical protein
MQKHVIEWLLERDQPAVRYRALLDLLDRKESDEEVRQARADIPRRGWCPEVLSSQKAAGFWEDRQNLYRPKYTATIWRLIVLADLGMTAEDERIKKPCELFLNEYSRSDGGFDSPPSGQRRSELCVTGNLARTLQLCGYGEDARVRSAYDWLVKNQMKDGGWHCDYWKAFGRGTLDCWEGLSAFAALPREKWSRQLKRSVERGAEFYLERRLLQQGRHRYLPWFRLHYPVHYYYDFLVGLDVITKLGYAGDRRLEPAIDLLKRKRTRSGVWILDRVHPDLGAGAGYRMKRGSFRAFSLEKEGEPSKWITLTALRVLKRVEEAR